MMQRGGFPVAPSKELVAKRHAWARHYMDNGAGRRRAEILARKKTERSPMPPPSRHERAEMTNARMHPSGKYDFEM